MNKITAILAASIVVAYLAVFASAVLAAPGWKYKFLAGVITLIAGPFVAGVIVSILVFIYKRGKK